MRCTVPTDRPRILAAWLVLKYLGVMLSFFIGDPVGDWANAGFEKFARFDHMNRIRSRAGLEPVRTCWKTGRFCCWSAGLGSGIRGTWPVQGKMPPC
jgi:hypothetical protein